MFDQWPGVTVLDISRLWARRDRSSPTGIDRLELRTAEQALAENAMFYVSSGRRCWFLDKGEVVDLTTSLRHRWTVGNTSRSDTLDRLSHVLGIANPEIFDTPTAASQISVRAIEKPSRLKAKARFLSGNRRLATHSNGDIRYLNVSHQHLENTEALVRLKNRWEARVSLYWHDAIPIRFPEYSAPDEPERHRKRLITALTFADDLMVNSRATAEDLKLLASKEGFDTPTVSVVPLDSQLPLHATIPDIITSRPYFITIGTIEPRKNHLLLLHTWRELAAELGENCPALVIIGNRGWMNEGTFAMLDRCEAIKAHVVEAPGLSDRSAATLLKGAKALLFPSFAEGFGLPLLESQRIGTPVIASNLNVFSEIAEKPFTVISPLDGAGWNQAIKAQITASMT